ncbi:hypothetical protein CU098_008263, partial [Rhizopus stolonifer]
ASPTFEAFDDQYGAYWSTNTCRRLKLNALSLYGKNQNNAVSEESTRAFLKEEQIRSIVASSEVNSEIVQYSNFVYMLSFMVHAIMINLTMFDKNITVDLDTIVPMSLKELPLLIAQADQLTIVSSTFWNLCVDQKTDQQSSLMPTLSDNEIATIMDIHIKHKRKANTSHHNYRYLSSYFDSYTFLLKQLVKYITQMSPFSFHDIHLKKPR